MSDTSDTNLHDIYQRHRSMLDFKNSKTCMSEMCMLSKIYRDHMLRHAHFQKIIEITYWAQ